MYILIAVLLIVTVAIACIVTIKMVNSLSKDLCIGINYARFIVLSGVLPIATVSGAIVFSVIKALTSD